MKKGIILTVCLSICLLASGFTFFDDYKEEFSFDVNDLYNYQKQYNAKEMDVCSNNDTKTYMDYRLTNDPTSRQYWFIKDNLYVDESGFLYDKDGFIAVALGSYYGEIGDRYYITLETGVVLPLVKAEEKADGDVHNGCYHKYDGSVMEFVIDTDKAEEYFGLYPNGLILQGNYNNYPLFEGRIVKIEKVYGEKIGSEITYANGNFTINKVFNYGSGY